jgi:hypothetical protein
LSLFVDLHALSPMTPDPKIPKDAKQAIDFGFDRGRILRQNGAPEKDLVFHRETFEQAKGFELECSPTRSHFYDHWPRGFDAGYLRYEKPTLADKV